MLFVALAVVANLVAANVMAYIIVDIKMKFAKPDGCPR
jgi:hypothetical protein